MTEFNEDVKNLDDIESQIVKLQEQAARIKAEKKDSVVQDVLRKIEQFEITAEDLGFLSPSTRGRRVARRATGQTTAPKYRDPQSGKSWSGVGREPKWFKEALEAGFSKEDLMIK